MDDVRAAVRAWLSKERSGPRSSGDMADIIEMMLGTGAHIGEVLALRWRDVDLGAQRVEINATIKTAFGHRTYRKSLTQPRRVEMSTSAVKALARRRSAEAGHVIDAVVPTRNATWQQVNNVERRWH